MTKSDCQVRIIAGTMIYVGANHVGNITGRGEVYVSFKNALCVDTVVARFKYKSAKASAVHWVKFILKHLTHLECVKRLEGHQETPIGIAEPFGYVSYNIEQAKKKGLV